MRKFIRVSFFVFSTALLATAQIQSQFNACNTTHEASLDPHTNCTHCKDHNCLTATEYASSDKDKHNDHQHQHSQSSCPHGHCMNHVNCISVIPSQSSLVNSVHSSLHFSRIEKWIPSDFINQLLRPPCA